LKNLPALPEYSSKILAAINDPDISSEQLANVLCLSPSIVARLLGLANSPYFGQPEKIIDLPTAIYKILGMDIVKSLALGIILNVHFDSKKCQGFSSKYFWKRSLLTAITAQKLAKSCHQNEFSTATFYAGGLLLNIGMLVLAYLMPERLNTLFQQSRQNQTGVGKEIIKELGKSHYFMGALLLEKWQLPSIYYATLLQFEDEEYQGEASSLIKQLLICDQLSFILINRKGIDQEALENFVRKWSPLVPDIGGIVDEIVKKSDNIEKLAAIMGN
jgi:HD-like signal output (HDOD) protein